MLNWLYQHSAWIIAAGACSILVGLIQAFTIIQPRYLIIGDGWLGSSVLAQPPARVVLIVE